ncbi:CD63 antigen [Trachymyrmex septentrionalis]|uniref:CD63 antigen n=2 Tax=Trachymyrmex septentrionalis TaxID=34720 RepID=A0A151JZ31_9HYME|nr:CD63 antigen [Trachymyrmex septentrionalis]
MVVTFACLLLTILIIQVAISIYVFVVVKNSDEIDFKKIYTENLFMKYHPNTEEKEFVDTIQKSLQCCGIDSYQDFPDQIGRTIPGSCCDKPASDICEPINSYPKGCVEALENLFKSALTVLGGVALGIAAAEVRN